MAIGLAQVCHYLGLNLIVVTDPKINRRILDLLRVYGVQIELVTKADASGNYPKSRLKGVRQLLDTISDSFWPTNIPMI